VDGGDVLTHAAWGERSNAVGRGLGERGVESGDRIGLLFGGRAWADFAVAHLGVLKAGAVAVSFSAGAASPDLARALLHSGATGLLCPRQLVPPVAPVWVADPEEVGRDQDRAPLAPAAESGTLAELIYPPAPLAVPAGWSRYHGDPMGPPDPGIDGWLVHTWAPGSIAGRHALELVRPDSSARTISLTAFDPDRLCAVAAGRRAVACGLTPALAAALVGSGAPRHYDLSSVRRVLLSGPAGPPVLAGLRAAFPVASVSEIGRGFRAPIAGDASSAPVAVSQEGMLWHEQFAPGSFNLPCLVRRYAGPLDPAALEWALSELVRRHQPLRSTFAIVDGVPRQIVGVVNVKLVTSDLRALRPAERDAEAARLLADATSRPFDLASGPLFEARLVRLGPDEHLLVVRLHHTVFDDWSVDVFRRELSALYAAGLAGAPSPLLEPPTSFADACRRQRAELEAGAGTAQRSWWRRELTGAPLAVQLPVGEADIPVGLEAEAGEPLRIDLPPALVADLRALAPKLRATSFMTVLAAFSVLLGRATGQDDVVIATVVAHRDQSDLEPLLGCFTKKVPLRLRLHGEPTFPELVARTRASLLGSLSHQDLAFDAALQDALGVPASAHGVVPHVAVVFQGETPRQVELAMPELAVSHYETGVESRRERHFSAGARREQHPQEPDGQGGAGGGGTPAWGDGIYLGTFLILSLLDTPAGMSLVARGVFHRPAAGRLLDDVRSLLADVVADPFRPVSALAAGGRAPARASPDEDVVDLRGFRFRRSHLETALATCEGVAEVAVGLRDGGDGAQRLVAWVVVDGDRPPTPPELRRALWAGVPGAPWPADVIVVDALPHDARGPVDLSASVLPDGGVRGSGDPPEADPGAGVLAAMWGEIRGRAAGVGMSYWQDFSFLQVLAEAREAGLEILDEQVVRCRTPEMLAVAMSAARTGTSPAPAP